MSNKTQLQSNNALLSQNNTDLQALINTANALPDAGGGGASIETCTVTITTDIAVLAYGVTRYVDGVLVCESDTGYGEQEFAFDDVVKGSCLSVVFSGLHLSEIVVTNCTAEHFSIANVDSVVTAFFRVND